MKKEIISAGKRGRRTFQAILLSVCGLALSTSAIPLWDIDFNGGETNQAPYTVAATAGIVNTNPTAKATTGSLNSLLVQDSFTAGSATMSGKPVVWTQVRATEQPEETSSQYLYLSGNASDYEAPTTNYWIEFDFMIQSEGVIGGQLELRVEGSGSRLVRAYFTSSGGFTSVAPGYPFEAGQGINYTDAWAFDTINHFALHYNGEEGWVKTYINDTLLGTAVYADWDLVADANKAVRTVVFTTQSVNATATLALDNIQSMVPEPSVFLLGLVGLGLVGCSRRLRRTGPA